MAAGRLGEQAEQPIEPSGVQLAIAIVPTGRHTRSISSATRWWSGTEHRPDLDSTTSKSSSGNGHQAWLHPGQDLPGGLRVFSQRTHGSRRDSVDLTVEVDLRS